MGVRDDSAADLGSAIAGGLESWRLAGRKSGEERKEGDGGVPVNWAETHPDCWSAPTWMVYRPLFMGADRASGDALQKFGRNGGDCSILRETGRTKTEIPVKVGVGNSNNSQL